MNQDLSYLQEAKLRFSGAITPSTKVERGKTEKQRYALLIAWCDILKACRVEYNIDDDA
jgi:hypothetical protein